MACGGQTIVQVAADAEVERPVSPRDRILDVESEFFHVCVSVKCEQPSSARQVKWQQDRVERRELWRVRRVRIHRRDVFRESSGRALGRVGEPLNRDVRIGSGTERQARRVESGINNPQVVVLVQKCLLVGDARLDVVDALHVGNTRAKTCVGERAILSDRFPLKAWRPEIREGIFAGIVIVSIAPDESADGQDGIGADQARPGRSDVEGFDF